ncbi:hypothetical protein J1N35_022799 [Gossypium stocksii]|uniref:Uncharacterized protein n=1 Tax=Gossypium stocksii TaxID=47602 RepID=A0A9D3VHB9_9ROSI|nr:hypothetical protein J1N35_022799 [Gossypium stocksii]
MLEEIRVNMMIRIVAKRKKCSSWKYNYGPLIKKKFDDNKKEGHLEQDPDDYLHRYYHKDTYLKTYKYDLHPINESHEWTKSGIEPLLPPIEKTILGRPKKNRRKSGTSTRYRSQKITT